MCDKNRVDTNILIEKINQGDQIKSIINILSDLRTFIKYENTTIIIVVALLSVFCFSSTYVLERKMETIQTKVESISTIVSNCH